MTVKKQFIIALTAAVFSFPLCAQEGMFLAHYHMAVPMGRFDDFQQNNSFRGFTVDYYHRFNNGIQLGGLFGWQIFHKEFPRSTYVYDDGAVTMKQWRYTHISPFAIVLRYGFFEHKRLSPYVGFGTGAFMVRQEVWVGLDEFTDNSWRYGFFPEAGLRLRVVDSFGFLLGSKYNFLVNAQGFNGEENLHYWDISLGAYIRFGRESNEENSKYEGTEYEELK